MNFTEVLKGSSTYFGNKGVNSSLIAQAQKSLGLRFSDEYIDYLNVIGIGAADGHEFTGLSASNRTNVVEVTIKEKERNPLVPQNYYVIEQAHIDDIVVWQDEAGRIYYSQPNRPPVKKFNSLLDYISQ